MFQYFKNNFLIFVLLFSHQVFSEVTQCLDFYDSQFSPLSISYRPHLNSRKLGPPRWELAKSLLIEYIPAREQRGLNQEFDAIDQLKGNNNYAQLMSFFSRHHDAWKEWSIQRDFFSIVKSNSALELAQNFARNDIFLFKLIINSRPLDSSFVQDVHAHLMDKNQRLRFNDRVRPGRFRTVAVFAGSDNRLYPAPADIQKSLTDYFEWYSKNSNSLHPIQLAAQSYSWIVSIQPFRNGNKRVARFIADWILIQHGYPPLIGISRYDSPNGIVFGTLGYYQNERPWESIKTFSKFLRQAVQKMNLILLEPEK